MNYRWRHIFTAPTFLVHKGNKTQKHIESDVLIALKYIFEAVLSAKALEEHSFVRQLKKTIVGVQYKALFYKL